MKINLTQEAKDFLDSQNKKEFRIELQSKGGWGGGLPEPVVKPGKPLDRVLENFKSYDVDGYTMYLQEYVDAEDEITIRFVKSLFLKQLVADGVS